MFIISEYHQEPDPSVEKVDTKAVFFDPKQTVRPWKVTKGPLKES